MDGCPGWRLPGRRFDTAIDGDRNQSAVRTQLEQRRAKIAARKFPANDVRSRREANRTRLVLDSIVADGAQNPTIDLQPVHTPRGGATRMSQRDVLIGRK